MRLLGYLICLYFFSYHEALSSPVFKKLDNGLRYQYVPDSSGNIHLVDTWLTISNVLKGVRFDPVTSNVYHLFTRENPTISQPILIGNSALLQQTNFNNSRRTIVLIHEWMESATSDFISVIVPAFLAAEDVNIIVVDWSVGASSVIYRVVIANTIASGKAVADLINWINDETQYGPEQYHIVGHGFGGHQAGIIGRNIRGNVAYITGLNPAYIGWVNHLDRFSPNDGLYTEVIHTNYGIHGYIADLAMVDFYPNGGISMPGCNSNACDHARSYFYFAESLASGGFTGKQCINYFAAVLNMCDLLPGRLQMGGLRPKFGSQGVYWLETNTAPPFSQG